MEPCHSPWQLLSVTCSFKTILYSILWLRSRNVCSLQRAMSIYAAQHRSGKKPCHSPWQLLSATRSSKTILRSIVHFPGLLPFTANLLGSFSASPELERPIQQKKWLFNFVRWPGWVLINDDDQRYFSRSGYRFTTTWKAALHSVSTLVASCVESCFLQDHLWNTSYFKGYQTVISVNLQSSIESKAPEYLYLATFFLNTLSCSVDLQAIERWINVLLPIPSI